MGKYQIRYSRPIEPSRINRQMHPIWRGVGFAFMILIPIMSYALARLFLDENVSKQWIVLPKNLLLQNPPLPQDLVILIMIMIILMLFIYAVVTFFSLLIFRVFAPPRYGPLDVPPIAYHGKSYKR